MLMLPCVFGCGPVGIRACIATSNAGAEACANWVMMHMEDADLNDPVPDANGSANEAGPPEQVWVFTVQDENHLLLHVCA